MGAKLTQRLHRPDARTLFSSATRAQLDLGREVTAQLKGKPLSEIASVMDLCLTGDDEWLDASRSAVVKPYTGPIAIEGDGEVKVYAYAEDAGVETTKTFTVRPAKAGAIQLDPDKPVVIKKRQKIATTIDVFSTLKALKVAHGKLKGSLAVTVGQGDVNATTRFGPQTVLAPDALEAFLGAGRGALGNETAETEVGFAEVHFETAREMEEFVKTVGWTVGPEEVEQS
jgi:hypothetical protein